MVEIYRMILSFLWSLTISLFAIPTIIDMAHRNGILDMPNFRTVHKGGIPRLGGVAVFAGTISSILLFDEIFKNSLSFQYILAASLLIFFIGLKDDISPVSAFKKFFVQILACGIVMFLGDVRIRSLFGVLGVYELEIGLSYFITFIIIIGLTNAFNLIDGINGLSSSVVVIVSLVIGYFHLISGGVYAIVFCAIIGGTLGFMKYNVYKARIFMGDTGSLVLGFMLATLSIETLSMKSIAIDPIIIVASLILPIMDTSRVFVLRTLDGKSPFAPDRRHLHHELMNLGLSMFQSLLVLIFINITFIALAFFIEGVTVELQLMFLFILSLIVCSIIGFGKKIVKVDCQNQ